MLQSFAKAGAWCGAVVAAAAALSGCGAKSDSASGASGFTASGDGPIHIVCTTGMVADVVRNVGGEHVRVTQLMAADVDPHLYKPSPGDVSALERAEMIFYSGLHLEAEMTRIFTGMAKKKPTFAVATELERWSPDRLIKTDGDLYDPHIWFDVSLWSETVKLVADRLADFDPDHADEYLENARSYRNRLGELHQWSKQQIATIPEQQRVLVTAHDAFHYFGRAYGLQVKAIQGVSTASEASVRDVEELVAFMVENEIKAVFVETSVPDDKIHSLIEGCEQRNHSVRRGGTLFSDAMGQAGTETGTYEGMIRHNVRTIVTALK